MVIYNWAFDPKVNTILEQNGYKHNEEVEGDVFEHTKILFDLGLNVMLVHGVDTFDVPVLFVDSKRFQQR